MRLSEQKKPTSKDVTKKVDYIRVLSKLTYQATQYDLNNLKDCLKLFLVESQDKAKSDFDKSCIVSFKHIYNDISLTLIRVSNEYKKLYESELN